jgi:hypothetical protein
MRRHGVKRREFKKIRVLLAAEGIFVPDMTRLKRYGFFTTSQYHEGDWKSPNGRTADGYTWVLKAIVPSSQAPHGPRDYEGDLEGAWAGTETIPPGRKRSWGEV